MIVNFSIDLKLKFEHELLEFHCSICGFDKRSSSHVLICGLNKCLNCQSYFIPKKLRIKQNFCSRHCYGIWYKNIKGTQIQASSVILEKQIKKQIGDGKNE